MEIRVRLPAYIEIPVDIQEFTEEENEVMIQVGSGAVLTMRTIVMGRSDDVQEQKKQYDKWIEEKKIENQATIDTYERMMMKEKARINEMIEQELRKERDRVKQQVEETNRCVEIQVNRYNEQIKQQDELIKRLEIEKARTEEQMKGRKKEEEEKIERELEVRTREKEEWMRGELEKYRERINEYEKRIIQTENKGNVELNNYRMTLTEKHNEEMKRLMDEKNTHLLEKQENEKRFLMEMNNIRLLMTEQHNVELKQLLEDKQRLVDEKNNLLLEKEQEENDRLLKMNQNQITITEDMKKLMEDNQRLIDEKNNLLLEREQEEKRLLMVENEELNQKVMKNNSTNNKTVGTDGERALTELLREAFKDHVDFDDIQDKSKTAHSGDIMAKFSKFTILIDSKVYKNGVDKKERDKLKIDISKNQYIKVAWLVSLENPIHKFSNYPVMYEVEEGVLYVYINSLLKKEDPLDILRTAYFSSEWIFDNILGKDDDKIMLNKYKKNELRIREIVNRMTKYTRERDATLKQLNENFMENDRLLRDILNGEIMSIQALQIDTVESWWKANIIEQDGNTLRSNVIYERFMNNNSDVLGINMTEELFKTVIISFLNKETVIIGKGKNTPHRIKNIGFKLEV